MPPELAKELRFLPPIPKGMRRLSADVEVAGVWYRLSSAKSFASGQDQELRFELEPNNERDDNAIKVIGVYTWCFVKWSVHIGYVPSALAKEIAEKGFAEVIEPRLRNIWWGGYVQDKIIIRFDILGPQEPKNIARK